MEPPLIDEPFLTKKSRQRLPRSTAAEKEHFFTVLARVGSVSVAARETGLPRPRAAHWAQAAGIASIHPGVPKRAEFLRLREAGVCRKEAAVTVGVSQPSAAKWEHAWDIANGRAAAPQPARLLYNQGVISTQTTPTQAEQDRVEIQELAGLEQPISSRYLRLAERLLIDDLRRRGVSLRAIAKELGRNVGTISREIQRNSHPTLGYLPNGAHRTSVKARKRPKERKITLHSPLWAYIEDKLRVRWSPEQISRTLHKDFPDDEQMHVSTETLYQTLYIQAKGEMKELIAEAMRTGRTRRKKHSDRGQRAPRFRDPMVNISERPPEVADRAIPGHIEGDLITGTQNKSAIGTLVERTSRYVMLMHLPNDHTAESVRDGLIATISTLPAHLRGSLTWDQGSEMAKHKAFTMATDMDVYFCDPASPWQRGTNENTNGLLRQYFPKGTDLSVYSAEDLEYVANELNARPRKTLGWRTPAEVFRDLLIPS